MRPNTPSTNVEDFETPSPTPIALPVPAPVRPPKVSKPARIRLDKIRRLKPRPAWAGAARNHHLAIVQSARLNNNELNRARRSMKKKTRFGRLFALADRLRIWRLEDAKAWHAERYEAAYHTRLRLRKRRARAIPR
jgi:hypothetical protein